MLNKDTEGVRNIVG